MMLILCHHTTLWGHIQKSVKNSRPEDFSHYKAKKIRHNRPYQYDNTTTFCKYTITKIFSWVNMFQKDILRGWTLKRPQLAHYV